MAGKRKSKRDDPAQSRRFVETARKLEVEDSGKAFKRVVSNLIPQKSSTKP
jgi:hypothetical protein